jgi:hypothetical protein
LGIVPPKYIARIIITIVNLAAAKSDIGTAYGHIKSIVPTQPELTIKSIGYIEYNTEKSARRLGR